MSGDNRLRALVVDTDLATLGAALPALEANGFSVDAARSGSQALAMARLAAYALILVDLGLADGGALPLVGQIREMGGHNREVPIVALTADLNADVLGACVDAGMNDFMVRPVDAYVLNSVVRRWCGRPRPGETAGAPRPLLDPASIDSEIFGRLYRALAPDSRRNLAARFVAEAERRVEALRAAAARRQHGAVREQAHALKSSAALFGLVRVLTISADIEQRATQEIDTLAAIESLAAAAAQACLALRVAVE